MIYSEQYFKTHLKQFNYMYTHTVLLQYIVYVFYIFLKSSISKIENL